MIDLSQFTSKAEVLARLYNASRCQGMGFLQAKIGPMTNGQAQELLDALPEDDKYFDYLHGKVMKVDLTGDTLDPRLYDRDNGPGAAARALGVQPKENGYA